MGAIRVAAGLTACLALALALWFSLLATQQAPDAVKYERAPDCLGLGSSVVRECATWAQASATPLSVHDYGLVVVTHVEVRTRSQVLVGDVVEPRWGRVLVQQEESGVALSWRGRLTAIRVSGQIDHTLQNPYLMRLWATILSAGLIVVGGVAAFVCFYKWDPQQATHRSQPSLDLIAAVIFLLATLMATYVSNSLFRIALMTMGWFGLVTFVIVTAKQAYVECVFLFLKKSSYDREYVIKSSALAVIGVMALASMLILTVGMTRSVLV